jgi:hypothetical protein
MDKFEKPSGYKNINTSSFIIFKMGNITTTTYVYNSVPYFIKF